MIWSTLHFIYVVFSVYLFFFLLPVIDIFLIDIHIMNGFNLLFPRLWCRCCCQNRTKSWEKFFFCKKKKCCNFSYFPPEISYLYPQSFVPCIDMLLFLCQSTHFLLHIYLLLWFFFVSNFIFMKTTKKSANIYL